MNTPFLLLLFLLSGVPGVGSQGTRTPTLTALPTATASLQSTTVSLTEDCSLYTKPTWFELNCPLHLKNRTVRYCIDTLFAETEGAAEGEGTITASEHEHGDTAPNNLLVLFGTFALGAFVRYWCLGTRVPFTVVMFIVGIAYGAMGKVGKGTNWDTYMKLADMDPHLILYIFLPVLIFESAFAMEIPVFKKVVWQCVIMAGPGLMIAATLTGLVAKIAFTDYPWSFPACLLFGTVLSATDPVAVVALLKELGASPVISTMIEGESLFNDGTAIVFFTVLEGAVLRKNCEPLWETCQDQCVCDFTCSMSQSPLEILLEFLRVALGGPVVGLLVGVVTVFSLNRVFNDTLIEVTLTLTNAYITFFLCEGFFHVSGVLGLVVLGCYMSYFRTCISPEVEHTLHNFWETSVFLTNSCIFALAGMIVALKAFDTVEATDAGYLFITYASINVIRSLVLMLFFFPLRLFEYKIDTREAALVGWGGLRGAVGLSLALVIQNNDEVIMPKLRDKLLFHTAGIVLLTLVVNGTTTQPLVNKLKLDAIAPRRRKLMEERYRDLKEHSAQEIIDLRAEPLYYDCNWNILDKLTDLDTTLPDGYTDPFNSKADPLPPLPKSQEELANLEQGRIAYLNTAWSSIHRQYGRGALAPISVRKLQKMVDSARELTPDNSRVNNPNGYITVEHISAAQEPDKCSFPWEKNSWIVDSFDCAVGFIQMHQDTMKRIRGLCEPIVANKIVTHCKKTIRDTVQMLDRKVIQYPHTAAFARSVRTKHAARHLLYQMRARLEVMTHEGRVDDADKWALKGIIEEQMKHVEAKFPHKMEHPTPIEALELTTWYSEIEDEAKIDFQRLASLPGSMETWPADAETSFLRKKSIALGQDVGKKWKCPGLFIIVTGVIQLRLGRKMYHLGAGHTLGLQSVLTGPNAGSERFSEVFTETKAVMLFLEREAVLGLINTYPSLASELWRQCGATAARFLMGVEPTYELWDTHKLRKVAEGGQCTFIQDSSHGDTWESTRRQKVPPDCITVLLRGRCWEFAEYEQLRFPVLLPAGFKYGTFTNFTVLFHMDESLWSNAKMRAASRWGRLKSKIRSISLWSGLRSPYYAKIALSRAFSRSPPPVDEGTAFGFTPMVGAETAVQLPNGVAQGDTSMHNFGALPLGANQDTSAPAPVAASRGLQVDPSAGGPSVASANTNKGAVESAWREAWNDKHQRPYYWNRFTRETTWVKPEELRGDEGERGAEGDRAAGGGLSGERAPHPASPVYRSPLPVVTATAFPAPAPAATQNNTSDQSVVSTTLPGSNDAQAIATEMRAVREEIEEAKQNMKEMNAALRNNLELASRASPLAGHPLATWEHEVDPYAHYAYDPSMEYEDWGGDEEDPWSAIHEELGPGQSPPESGDEAEMHLIDASLQGQRGGVPSTGYFTGGRGLAAHHAQPLTNQGRGRGRLPAGYTEARF